MTRKIFLFFFLIFSSCKQEFKQCTFNFADQNQNLYNEVLTHLVENRFYNFYLGENTQKVYDLFIPGEEPDTAKIEKLLVKYQNKLFKDSTKFCVIYLDTVLPPNFRKWSDYSKDSSAYSRKIRNILKDYAGEETAVLDSLNSVQKRYSSNDLQLCTSKVKSIKDFAGFENYKGRCLIGKVVFSKVYFNNQKNKALLYYELKCGEDMCGMGEIIEIKKIDGRWRITQYFMQWVS